MQKNTPLFNQALEELYIQTPLVKRRCEETGEEFEITGTEVELYKNLSLPLPHTAPYVRLRQARAHIGGLELFPRETIEGKPTVSMYDPGSPAPLTSPQKWHSDEFDALKYGQLLDPMKPFFQQWTKFSNTVPRPSIITDPTSENCNWCLYDISFRNSYATYGGVACDTVLYTDMSIRATHSVDVANIIDSEWSYESVSMFQCSQAHFSENCTSCLNVYFCFGCVNLSDSFGCVNLKNKQYCFLNVQLTLEEYKKRISQIDLSDAAVLEYWQQKTRELWQQGYYMAEANLNSEESKGDGLVDCKEVSGISVFQSNRVYNAFDVSFAKDSCDIQTSSNLERCGNVISCTNGYENKMCVSCHGCIDIEYSELCISCEHCFGCIGLKRKKFCIFNVQYSEEEYWKKLDHIKTEMLKRGEYGKNFPYSTSLLAYNTSHADPFFPLSEERASSLGARWYTFPPANISNVLVIDSLPTKLSEVTPDILNQQFLCPETCRPFRIVKPELEFHQKMTIALPRVHPVARRKNRYTRMLGLHLFDRSCKECGTSILTRVSPASQVSVTCSTCYNQILLDDRMLGKI